MQRFLLLLKESYAEFKNVRCITLAAMFGAISIVLGSLTVMVADYLKIGFSFLPNRFVFFLFGPLVGGFYGAAMDILTFIVKPTGTFHPGFTFNAVLTGIIFGFILYKKPVSIKRILIASIIHMVVINFFLTTLWLTTLTGRGFFVMLPARALKALIMLPIETILFYTVVKGVEASGILKLIQGKKSYVQ
ncbi:folate family ECF transporter S component [Mobilitalea sibirica]|uniref:Folate family ECF transporter S component n=1 Tax=Mobilitalea sibirica TaxID=1462919 RepID=A0A8J7HBY9_9FIRM|nr:folate family ECF transporter S component [Mobilitalea sibirica]MBH1941621.1 folate family ECF transporter S component [Mobilitalea sibirica]